MDFLVWQGARSTFARMSGKVKIIECPRDAMQGIEPWIPTEVKIRYINQLLRCGFDTIDFGSFVSEKAIPQMRDSAEVLRGLDLNGARSRLLAIVANTRGAETAAAFDEIHYLGYPFSVSETFQRRNTNASIEESLYRVGEICDLAARSRKEMVVYLSMGFGNPYGDPWNPEVVIRWSERLSRDFGIKILALSDTIGAADTASIQEIFTALIPALPEVEFGAHLHCRPENAWTKLEAAYNAGCIRFDGAVKGYGGCPMATDDLTGNMPSERMLDWFKNQGIETGVSESEFARALNLSAEVFPAH